MFTFLAVLTGCGTNECADDEGLLTGTVTVDGEVTSSATVSARVQGEEPQVDAHPVNPDGSYAFCLPQGLWLIEASGGMCGDEDQVSIEAGAETTADFDVSNDCVTADKPNLYLYPSAPTRTAVSIGIAPQQRIFASEPPYGRGWRGVAMPNGTFSTLAGLAPFLFYEVSLRADQVRAFQTSEGWCVDGDVPSAVRAMADILAAYGFNAGEVDDFVEGWRNDLPPASAYAVYPQLDVDHAASLHIFPALPVDRLWLLVEEAGSCTEGLPEPVVVPFDRTGAHGVEWGVVLRGIAK